MHASIACLLLYEDYVWVSLGNAMKAKQSKAKPPPHSASARGSKHLYTFKALHLCSNINFKLKASAHSQAGSTGNLSTGIVLRHS
jgi:hypothetical protein